MLEFGVRLNLSKPLCLLCADGDDNDGDDTGGCGGGGGSCGGGTDLFRCDDGELTAELELLVVVVVVVGILLMSFFILVFSNESLLLPSS